MAVVMTPFIIRGLPEDSKSKYKCETWIDTPPAMLQTVLSNILSDEECLSDTSEEKTKETGAIETLKNKVFWTLKSKRETSLLGNLFSIFKHKDDEMIDSESGLTLLMCAVMMNDEVAVKEILMEIAKMPNKRRRDRILNCRTLQEISRGYLSLPSDCTTVLHIAMFSSSPDIVEMLLENGVDPHVKDKNGASPFMTACQFGRIDNLDLWFKRFPSHNIHERENIVGAFALSFAVYNLPNKIDTFEFLLKHGADPDLKTFLGTSVLQAAVRNVDVDLRAVEKILAKSKDPTLINYRVTPSNLKWKWIYFVIFVL